MKWVDVPYTDQESCTTFFEIDKNENIVNVRTRGDGC